MDAKGVSVPHSTNLIEGAFMNGDETEESKANDRLIAAAPEMLDLLLDFYINYDIPHKLFDVNTKKRFRDIIKKAIE
ncbi:MAG: hypothetical protein ACTSQG_00205 [Promethearchaeota archaeon]